MTRQAKNQRIYPLIPVPAYIKEAVRMWAKENSYKMYKIGEFLETIPELKQYIERAKGNDIV